MLLKEFINLTESKLLAEDVPIIINSEITGDAPYTVRLEQNPWGRWAIMIDVES